MEVVVTQDNVVHGIFFQDEEMRRMYDRFPSFHVAQRLASLVSESPMREFNGKLATLNRLLHMWEQGDAVILSSANELASAGMYM